MDLDLNLSFESENRMFDCNVDEDVMSTPSITKCILPTTTVSKRNLSVDGSFDLRLEQQWGDMSEVSIEVTPVAARTLSLEADEEVEALDEEAAPTSAERRRKQREEEEEASERLAWELMQQEQDDLYNMQLQYIQQQATTMSADDFNALQQVLREAGAAEEAEPTGDAAQEGDAGDEEGADAEAEGEGEGEEQWDYERLLALGQALGDVKTERWRLQSQRLIDSLPEMRYARAKRLHGDGRDAVEVAVVDLTTPPPARAEVVTLSPLPPLPPAATATATASPGSPQGACDRCSICMDFFQDSDLVKVLPCSHCFHPPCAQGWIRDHNSCAYCTVKIVRSPAQASVASVARV